jgi:hypothetical protein
MFKMVPSASIIHALWEPEDPVVLLLWTQFIFLIRVSSCFILSPAESNFLSEANQAAEKEAAT